MAHYTYACKNEHEAYVYHPIEWDGKLYCPICLEPFWRLPPRGVSYYNNPMNTLYDMADKKFVDAREKSRKREKNG